MFGTTGVIITIRYRLHRRHRRHWTIQEVSKGFMSAWSYPGVDNKSAIVIVVAQVTGWQRKASHRHGTRRRPSNG